MRSVEDIKDDLREMKFKWRPQKEWIGKNVRP